MPSDPAKRTKASHFRAGWFADLFVPRTAVIFGSNRVRLD